MKSDLFRVHGDNIVECERIIKIIKNSIEIKHETRKFISQAVVEYNLEFFYDGKIHNWRIELFPGFNKRGRSRWGYNIFESLKAKGSFLDETPDAILTKVIGSKEIVLLAIEFSSALNAGNQAWQRSGRAYSTAKIGVPYLYLDEFVRYEINSSTRSRKNLRFPNAAIPYSYINMSNVEKTFLAQCFIKSEEFDRTNPVLKNFSENIFSFNDISDYIILSLLDCDVSDLENRFKLKNLEMVKFLSPDDNSDKSKSEISKNEWEEIYNGKIDIIDVSKRKKLVFNKIIQSKSITASSKTNEFNNLVKKYAYGISSEGLPFGCIPKEKRKNFLEELVKIYTIDDKFKEFIQNQNKDLLICLVKGFKPRGDDNRPDRGILPFLSMLTSDKNEILSYIYGPMSQNYIDIFINNYAELAARSGFWNVFVSLSDAILIDVPILKSNNDNIVFANVTSDFKKQQIRRLEKSHIAFDKIPILPNSVHEDDVDTSIHLLFTSYSNDVVFESSCNPPGGDWSGISIKVNDFIYRWLSLPRAPENSKRPDHILEFYSNGKRSLLIIESKDYPRDVIREGNLDKSLKEYLENLLQYPPSAIYSNSSKSWEINLNSEFLLSIDDFTLVTAAAFIKKDSQFSVKEIFKSSECDILFIFEPITNNEEVVWNLEILTNTKIGEEMLKVLVRENLINIAKKIGINLNY